jgi:hypothetical protein
MMLDGSNTLSSVRWELLGVRCLDCGSPHSPLPSDKYCHKQSGSMTYKM